MNLKRKNARILLVEDDLMMNLMISTLLSQSGYKAMCVFNGDDAMKKLKEQKFDILITDILMPGKEGIEVIQETKEYNPDIKIIAISAGGQVGRTTFLDLARAHGADIGMDKPFMPDVLLSHLESITEA